MLRKIREDLKNTNLEEINNNQETQNISEKNGNTEEQIKNENNASVGTKSNYREKLKNTYGLKNIEFKK